jgi:hypothetical protein
MLYEITDSDPQKRNSTSGLMYPPSPCMSIPCKGHAREWLIKHNFAKMSSSLANPIANKTFKTFHFNTM